VNLALARGMIGREKCGLMPIRGHSGVQGGSEVGCSPSNFPGGDPICPQTAEKFSKLWGFPVPSEKGLSCVQMLEAAHQGELDLLYSAGGNFLETLPEPELIRKALARIPLRVHQDIVLSSQMFVDPAETVLLLPAQTRYEQRGGGTETSTERQIIFSPEIPGRRIGETKPEWEIFMLIAEHAIPEKKHLIHFDHADQIRQEMAQAVPFYDGIQHLNKPGDAVQWGGPILCKDGKFPTSDGKARFALVQPPEQQVPAGYFMMSTRRGKQFNSMVQQEYDPLTGVRREDVLMNAKDIQSLGLKDGDLIFVRSKIGEFRGRVKTMPIQPRNIQIHWPEANVLIQHGEVEPLSGVPDYNALVRISVN
jgi:predicted molibdopterin-dependent oxidoreductase YjgC